MNDVITRVSTRVTSGQFNLLNANEQVYAQQELKQYTSVPILITSLPPPRSHCYKRLRLLVSLPPIPMLSDILDHVVSFSKEKKIEIVLHQLSKELKLSL
ncbi:hypothetical protein AVEN_207344-1 [Araneus ventricosus]|uniref:Uncharacterized protein n=1 Tax=Araneus ventricosus TaxID=182803 RepID=A0A4Y2IU84_ARAVE|nr:hypothetical protein AVEN_207344-1 [Araneus ventricosus]